MSVKDVELMTYEELLTAPPTQRELIGDQLFDVMWAAAKQYMADQGLIEKQLYMAELRAQENLLDITVDLSWFVMQCKQGTLGFKIK